MRPYVSGLAPIIAAFFTGMAVGSPLSWHPWLVGGACLLLAGQVLAHRPLPYFRVRRLNVMSTLPTFRSLSLTAARLILTIAPLDGAALSLAQVAASDRATDNDVLTRINSATLHADGMWAVLTALHDWPGFVAAGVVRERLRTIDDARKALHAATMAYYGESVTVEAA